MNQPTIVCICGSTKFKKEWEKAIRAETMTGKIVLSVAFYTHADNLTLTKKEKTFLDKLHLKKIDLADEILVINKNGYIGDSTRLEIAHARSLGKPVTYMNCYD